MKLKTVLALTAALGSASVGTAQADVSSATVASAAATTATGQVYEGVDTAGHRIRLTISDVGPQVLVQVDRQPALPAAHWTSLIGTGSAATAER